jgi:two-component system sensor histidine kinase HydH
MAQVVSLALAHLEQGSERRDTPSAGLPGADVAQAVRASEELLQSVFDGMGSGVLVLDEAGTIMLANTAALRMLQLPELGRLRGRRLDSLLEGSDFFTACTATGSQQQAVITLADGRTRSIGFTVSTVPTVGHRIVVFRDLTPLLENEKRRQRAEQLAQVGEMAAKLGHEIKNPLTSIVVGLQALRECAPLTGEDLDTLVDVMNEVQSLGAVVGDLLDSTRFSSLAPRPQDVPLIMQRLLRSQANLAASSGVDLTLVSGPIPCIAVLDTKGLSRVISNLVLNAVEACDAGDRIEMGWRMLDGAEVRRRFAGFPGDVLCIFVRDTGPGIPDEVVDQMFEPFMTTKEHGTGLGLSVVKEVVDLMGGVVDVRTGGRLDGRGTRFELMFPAGDRPTCHARTRDGARDCPQKFDCPVQYGESHYVCWTIKGQESRLETGRWEEACCECPVYRAGCLSAYWQI